MTKKHPQPDLCPLCGGAIEAQMITHEERDGQGIFYIFENVPARCCSQCGEIWLPASTVKLLDQALAHAKPLKVIKTPVFDLATPLP